MVTRSQGSQSAAATTPQREPSYSVNQPNALPLARPSRDQLLTIKAACQLMGVDRSTLRRWSNAGKVPVYRTPGGHRRYREDDIRALMGAGLCRQERPRTSRQGSDDRSPSGYEGDDGRGVPQRPWYAAYPPSMFDELRRVGQRLVDITARYVAAAPAAEERGRLLAEARQIGEIYGRTGAQVGLSVSEMVEAFLYFRRPVNRTVVNLFEESDLPAKRLIRLCSEAGLLMDEVLVATVRAYDHGDALTESQFQRLQA